MRCKTKIVLLIIFLFVSLNIKSESNQEHHHDHSPHLHGLANLTLAIEENELQIQLESPAANLLGFEHRAHTAEEKARLKQAQELLRSPEKLFLFRDAECKLKEMTLDTSSLQHDDAHSEIMAYYLFHCEEIDNLTAVTTQLFIQFSGIETINAMWITETGQQAAVLNNGKNIIQLR